MTDDNPPASRTPSLDATAFDCPRCGTYAKQSWAMLTQIYQVTRFDDSATAYGRWNAARCDHCNEWSVWREDRMMYPGAGAAPTAHPSMPPEAKALYDEAREVLGISRRAGTALARASLERLLRTLDPEAGRTTLDKRIERILPPLPDHLGQMLTIIRVAGNASLHVDDEPDDVMVLVLDPGEVEVVELMFEAINELVDERIAKPQKVASLYDRVPESIRERMEKARRTNDAAR